MAGPYFFAWVDAGALPWSPTYAREDEDVYSFNLTHSEGDFPTLDVTIRNPRVGLLASGRKQWAWLSYQPAGAPAPIPLFYGRILGVPQSMAGDQVRLTFIARPSDYETQKRDLADTLRELPYFDPVWLPEDQMDDPDLVLEARTEVWHIDRITHAVTTSDIIAGENGGTIAESDALYDSLEVSYASTPVSQVIVHAELGWQQRGSGNVDLSQRIIEQFAAITPAMVYDYKGAPFSTAGQIVTIGGEQLEKAWPQPERRIGGGWTVGDSGLQLIGQPPMPALGMDGEVFRMMRDSDPTAGGIMGKVEGIYQTVRDVLARTPGYVVQVVHHAVEGSETQAGQVDFVIVPVWRMAPVLNVQWAADRTRREFVDFTLTADVQPLLADAGDDGIEYISIGPAYVDEIIEDVRSPSYLKTDRGLQSMDHLVARARALLLYRARAVNVSLTVGLDAALDWSCRKSLTINDPRLPGGVAAGKVKSYSLSVNGDEGEAYATVTLGCTVGRNGSITPVAGTPVYVEEGYVNPGHQRYEGRTRISGTAGDVGYTGIEEAELDDDGQDLFNVTAESHLLDIGASGGLVTQESRLNVDGVNPDAVFVVDRVNGVRIDAWLEMRPVTGGPFLTMFAPELTELAVPMTIDLEAN